MSLRKGYTFEMQDIPAEAQGRWLATCDGDVEAQGGLDRWSKISSAPPVAQFSVGANMQAAIRERDIALQGSINPVLARFGAGSELCNTRARPAADAISGRSINERRARLGRLRRGPRRARPAEPLGEQVSDLLAGDHSRSLSSGRAIDYQSKLYLTEGDVRWSYDTRPMFTIVRDDVRRHNFLLTPGSRDVRDPL